MPIVVSFDDHFNIIHLQIKLRIFDMITTMTSIHQSSDELEHFYK